jgi:hypothetical protein
VEAAAVAVDGAEVLLEEEPLQLMEPLQLKLTWEDAEAGVGEVRDEAPETMPPEPLTESLEADSDEASGEAAAAEAIEEAGAPVDSAPGVSDADGEAIAEHNPARRRQAMLRKPVMARTPVNGRPIAHAGREEEARPLSLNRQMLLLGHRPHRPPLRQQAEEEEVEAAADQRIVYADDGSVQGEYSKDLLLRIAARWTGQPANAAKVDEVTEVDQWTVAGGLRSLRPLWKYTFSDGQQVYVNGRSGEVVQYTTLGSRIGAELGPIPHWLYYTPLRIQQKLWSNLIIWASGIGTVMALMGLIVGISLYSPSRRYQFEGAPARVPYTGQKRLHMILGLFFGILTCTWAFSGMLSMDPFPVQTNRGPNGGQAGGGQAGPGGGRGASPTGRIQAVLRASRFQMTDYAAKVSQSGAATTRRSKSKAIRFHFF